MECRRRFILRRDATSRRNSRNKHRGDAVADHDLHPQRGERVWPHHRDSDSDRPITVVSRRQSWRLAPAGLFAHYFTVISRLNGDAGETCAAVPRRLWNVRSLVAPLAAVVAGLAAVPIFTSLLPPSAVVPYSNPATQCSAGTPIAFPKRFVSTP